MNREDVITKIVTTAAGYANDELPSLVEGVQGSIFQPNYLASQRQGFCLTYSDDVFNQMDESRQAELRGQLADLAKRSIRKALLAHRNEFVGLMLGYAKQGKNFFEAS